MQIQNAAAGGLYGSQARSLTYVKNERMAGMIPKWVNNTIEGDNNTARSSFAPNTGQNIVPELDQNPEFWFGDILDMVNPLQHIPIVGNIYRELTGDTIHPASKIIGGAVFGGAAGAALGVIDTVAVAETGKDTFSNAYDTVTRHKKFKEEDNNALLTYADLSALKGEDTRKTGLYAL